MVFLFIATIGPVQPFIASASRTRDLYIGSTLLSELSKAAANAVVQHEEDIGSLVFPSPLDKKRLLPDTPFKVANKVVAVVQRSPEQLGEQVRKAIQQRIKQVQKQAFDKITLVDPVVADAQLMNLVEYSWVAVHFEHDSGYEKARERAEAILGARKNTHFFREVTWGSHMEKSSIDGQRECVIPSHYYPSQKASQDDKTSKARSLYTMYKAGSHERLSAVDLLKRLAWPKSTHNDQHTPLPLIHSTSHIAAIPFLERLKEMYEKNRKDGEEAKILWGQYRQQAEKLAPFIVELIADKLSQPHPVTGDVDGALLFKERLLDDTVHRDKLPDVDSALDAFFRFTDRHLDGLRPSPYYAILLADGDGMGKVIEAQARQGAAAHRKLSRTLAEFADKVSTIVERHKGSLVYAGGDDVLALLPLHTALQCAKELADIFREMLGIFAKEDGPTLSAGIAVVHHVSLLQDALELARATEHAAKEHDGKNALALMVRKRGGEQNEMVVSWNDVEARLDLLVTLYHADIIPDGMAYELRTMIQRLQSSSRTGEQRVELQEIVQIEAARILRRKLYFSREQVTRQDSADIAQLLVAHLQEHNVPPETIKKLEKPQDMARYILLEHIGVRERARGGFEILESKHVAPFVNALIVAQTFAEALKPGRTKGVAE